MELYETLYINPYRMSWKIGFKWYKVTYIKEYISDYYLKKKKKVQIKRITPNFPTTTNVIFFFWQQVNLE